MVEQKKEIRKRKLLEGMGCLLYMIAFVAIAAVFIVRCNRVF